MQARVEGAGPEQVQYAKARAAFALALAGRPLANRAPSGRAGPPLTYRDVQSPQLFAAHPVIRYALAATAVGLETSYAHLPGRQPVAGWNGEVDATAPAITQRV